MGVSKNSGFSPQIIHGLIGFSIVNHPFWGTTIFGNTLLAVWDDGMISWGYHGVSWDDIGMISYLVWDDILGGVSTVYPEMQELGGTDDRRSLL